MGHGGHQGYCQAASLAQHGDGVIQDAQAVQQPFRIGRRSLEQEREDALVGGEPRPHGRLP